MLLTLLAFFFIIVPGFFLVLALAPRFVLWLILTAFGVVALFTLAVTFQQPVLISQNAFLVLAIVTAITSATAGRGEA